MKKAMVLVLLVALVAPIFADDAITLPARVIRARLIPSWTTIGASFDSDGEKNDLDYNTSVSLFTLSAALEVGVNDWLTAALQWTPGWHFSSSVSSDVAAVERQDLSGVNDLFIGAKAQILGDQRIVPHQTMRFAAAAGALVPLSQYDAADERQNLITSTTASFRPARTDRGAVGLGGRFYFDYVINQNLFINLYNQTIFFLETTQDYAVNTSVSPPVAVSDVDVKYGTELTFELEPNYTMPLSDGLRFSAGLPITYVRAGETEINGNGQDDASYTLSIGPSVSFFLTSLPLPMDFELGYSLPLMGENARATNTLTLQIKTYARF